MRKIYTSIISLFLLSSSVFAQIPNSGFESWVTVNGHQNPASWGTLNDITAASNLYTATKGTPGSPGTAYLNLTSKTIAGSVVNGIAVSGVLDSITKLPKSGFPFTDRPQVFTGKWQHMIYGSSQGSVSVTLTKWNSTTNQRDIVASKSVTLSGMAMSWANFSLTLTYLNGNFPDSCMIVLKASGTAPTNNDYLWVDNLAFTGSVVGIDNNENSENAFSIYPNPTENQLNISMNNENFSPVSVQIIDLLGRIQNTYNFEGFQGMMNKNISVSALSKGGYFLKISSDKGSVVKHLVVQ